MSTKQAEQLLYKSCHTMYEYGDKASKILAQLCQSAAANLITEIRSHSGLTTVDQQELNNEFKTFYSTLYTSESPCDPLYIHLLYRPSAQIIHVPNTSHCIVAQGRVVPFPHFSLPLPLSQFRFLAVIVRMCEGWHGVGRSIRFFFIRQTQPPPSPSSSLSLNNLAIFLATNSSSIKVKYFPLTQPPKIILSLIFP